MRQCGKGSKVCLTRASRNPLRQEAGSRTAEVVAKRRHLVRVEVVGTRDIGDMKEKGSRVNQKVCAGQINQSQRRLQFGTSWCRVGRKNVIPRRGDRVVLLVFQVLQEQVSSNR